MSVDPELAAVPSEADEGNTTSPLYLAISLGKEDIAEHLIQKTNGKLSCSGPDGRNVLHAAVTRSKALPMLLKLFKDVTVQVQQGEGARRMSTVPLLSQLTMQRDIDGSTPLHLAASTDWWPEVSFVSERFKHIWPRSKSTTTLLLDANICSAYQPDNEGLYPIHIAALADNLDVTKILLQRCPDCANLQDSKGRTFLHVATQPGIYKVARNACAEPELLTILNVRDNNGDTALHHAVHEGNLAAFSCLIQNPKVDLSIANKDELTPLHLSWVKIPQGLHYLTHPRVLISRTLLLVGAPAGGSRSDLFREKYFGEIDVEKKSKDLAKTTQAMGIVSVLIATVTFASAFTLPGGYYQSSSDGGVPGTPILAGSYAFNAFILADALAFICSCLATFSLVFAGVPAMGLSARYRHTWISTMLLHASGASLMASFALGLYLVLAPIAHAIAITVCVISSGALVFGNLEGWRMLCVLNTARARLGTRRLLATWWNLAPVACFSAFSPFVILIVIFDLIALFAIFKTLSNLLARGGSKG
ncbi:protein ACCELERATED CELL DEATH 6-like [Panicum hallii]|nr:protein ACCELERATED CELL DEATH 6-like [Panicum hallii]